MNHLNTVYLRMILLHPGGLGGLFLIDLPLISKGDIIVVKWLDACETRNVPVEGPSEKHFVTLKETIGKFYGFKRGSRIQVNHLILIHEISDAHLPDIAKMTITSIPIPIVIKVEKLKV